MKLRNVLLAATILAAPVAVKAQPVTGLYVGAGAGFDYLTQTNIKSLSTGTVGFPSGLKAESRGGYTGEIAVGYGLGNGLRFELEGNYIKNHYHIKQNAAGVGGGGDIQTYGPMFNALFDFDVGLGFMYPYVGVGVGYELSSQEHGVAYGQPGQFPNLGLYKGAHGSFAAQAILGASFPIAGVPGLSFTADARFNAQTSQETFRGDGLAGVPAGRFRGAEKLDNQFNVAGLVGLRYAFNAAPPPPPPAPVVTNPPAAGVGRTYLVFFDWDRSDLTARARQIVAEAAAASTKTSYTKIQVSGYADTSGTARYNQGLSLRRAETVAAELVRDGVPRSAIAIQAFGDTHLLVPTGPGVREPQNRRVEIVLQ